MTDVEVKNGSTGQATRTRLIEAAVDIVFEDGASKLSLNAVAERAGVSKGGLLYHFNSKADLLRAMVATHVETMEQAVRDAYAVAATDGKPNAFIRAYIKASYDDLCDKKKPHTGFLAAVAEQPDLLVPVRSYLARFLAEMLEKSENPDLAQTAFLAVTGSWHLKLFDISPFSPETLREQYDRLTELLAHPPAR